MPQFDIFSFNTQLFWVFFFFVVLYSCICFIILPALSAILKTRKIKLAQTKISADILESKSLFIKNCFKHEPKIKVVTYEGLTVHFCQKNNVDYILRGLRNPADFEFEKAIAHTNRDLAPIETVFLLTAANTSYISSSIVRDVIRNDGDYTKLVPATVRVQ